MNVLDLRIGRQNEIGPRPGTQDRGIIADAEGPVPARGMTRATRDTCDQGRFTEFG
jgi:hypothetical protein